MRRAIPCSSSWIALPTFMSRVAKSIYRRCLAVRVGRGGQTCPRRKPLTRTMNRRIRTETTARSTEVVMAEVAEQSRSGWMKKRRSFLRRVRETSPPTYRRRPPRRARVPFLVPVVHLCGVSPMTSASEGRKKSPSHLHRLYILPLDICLRLFSDPRFLDDLVLSVYILNKIMLDTDQDIILEHWS